MPTIYHNPSACCSRTLGCGLVFASGYDHFFVNCVQSSGIYGCDECENDATSATPTKAVATLSGVGSTGACTQGDGNNLNRAYSLTSTGGCQLSEPGTSIQLCGAVRQVSVTLIISADLATVQVDTDGLGTAEFTKIISTPSSDCAVAIDGSYTFSSYDGTALDFGGASLSVECLGCELAPYWELLDGDIVADWTYGDGFARSDDSFKLRMSDDEFWPQRRSCKWEVTFYPETDGDSISLFMGWSETERFEACLTALEGTPMLELWHWTGNSRDANPIRRKVNYDSTFTFPLPYTSGLVLTASLCRRCLLISVPALTRWDYDGSPPPYPPYHNITGDTLGYLWRPLTLSSGGGGPGTDIVFDSGRWGIGGTGNYVFGLLSANNTTDNIEDLCPPDNTCSKLLTETPIEITYSVRDIASRSEAWCMENPHSSYRECESMNGTFVLSWRPVNAEPEFLCYFEQWPNSVGGNFPNSGDPGCDRKYQTYWCDDDEPVPAQDCIWGYGGFSGFAIAHGPFGVVHNGGGQIRWDLPITVLDTSYVDIAGEPDSLGSPKYFWVPVDINYGKWHKVGIGSLPEENDCDFYDTEAGISAEMRVEGFTYEASDDAP